MPQKQWSSQFRYALKSWTKDPGNLADPLDLDIDDPSSWIKPWLSEGREERDDLFNLGFLLIAYFGIDEAYYKAEQILGASESPIEAAMGSALYAVARVHADEVRYRHHGTPEAPTDIAIEQQAIIGDYRVDFLIIGSVMVEFASAGGPKYGTAQMIVECDGHDYHEKTKEQAKRDKSRDRQLQAAGYPVFRYTGSEIWADVFGCATEVIHHVLKTARENARQYEDRERRRRFYERWERDEER